MAGFDKYASRYERSVQSSIDFSGLDHDFFMRAKASILNDAAARHFGESAKLSLLDVGCGIGLLHPLLGERFGRISGVDMSAESIDRAKTNNPGNEYVTVSGTELPFGSGTFDVVTTVCVVHHVAPRMRPAFLTELKRVARSGGLVCVIEHNPLNPLTRLAVLRCPFDADAVLLSGREARRLLTEAGLANVQISHFLLFPMEAWRSLELRLRKLPLGAQYLAVGEKQDGPRGNRPKL